MSWYVPEADALDSIRIYTGFASPGENLEIVDLPAAQVTSIIHRGPMQDIGRAYLALAHLAESNGQHDPHRRRLIFLEAAGDDQTEWVVDVQLELTANY